MNDKTLDLPTSYSRIAGEYARSFFNELDHKPLDRELLERLARQVKNLGPVCDLGCGPGQIARYLAGQGVNVFGLDLSPEMIVQARQLNPDLDFKVGDILALEAADASWGGIAAFYSIIHIPRNRVVDALTGLRRVLRPGGLLLLAFHVGQEIMHVEEMWGQPVSVDFIFFEPEEMFGYLEAAGFEVEEIIERAPYPEIEYQSRRAYIFARKPESQE